VEVLHTELLMFLNPDTRQKKEVFSLTQLLYPEYGIMGGCLDDLKTRETLPLAEIDR